MPTRTDPWPAGTPCWVDLSVPDLAAAKEFYGAVFGWSFLDSGADLGNYQICQVDGRAAAAIGPCQAEGQPTAWTVYLASEDADGTAKLIVDNGGTVLAEPFDISLPAISKHLTVLEDAGLLARIKEGRTRRCRLLEEPMREALEWIASFAPDGSLPGYMR